MECIFKRLKTFSIVSAVAIASAYSQQSQSEMDLFIDNLLNKMTLEETGGNIRCCIQRLS